MEKTSLPDLPKRLKDSNKGTYGRVLVIAGSPGMSGAAYLSALAAYRCGAGLVRILTVPENRMILQIQLPEAIVDLRQAGEKLRQQLVKLFLWADFVVIGPGIGREEEKDGLMRIFFAAAGSPGVLGRGSFGPAPSFLFDADALNRISASESLKESFKVFPFPKLVTPHPLEMSRLTGLLLPEILNQPLETASDFSRSYRSVTVLKGSHTVVTSSDGERFFVNEESAPALSKGGSGDVLTGAVAGIWEILKAEHRAKSQGGETQYFRDPEEGERLLYEAALCAVRVHVIAGRLAAEAMGEHAVLSHETADLLGRAMEQYRMS